MKKAIIIFSLIVLAVVAFTFGYRQGPQQKPLGANYTFTTATSTGTSIGTSTTAGIYSWAALKYSGNGSQGFVSFCDNADSGVSANNPVYLGLGATSTKPYGIRIASGGCYTMTLAADNMFYGTVYVQASTATSTILEIYK
jgi:hypothetical protein